MASDCLGDRMADAGVLRLVTINFWGTQPPLDGRLELAAEQLGALQPDVVCMQEVRPLDGKGGDTSAAYLASRLGFESIYEIALEWDDDDFFPGHPGGQEGLAILTRHVVREHRVLALPDARPTESRILLSALVEGRGAPAWCHTTHLHYRLADGLARERQVVAIDDAIRGMAGEGGDVHILCGDFNAPPEADEIRFLRGLTTLAGRRTHYQDAFARVHPGVAGHTWSSENEHTRPLRSLDIDRRIDYIFVSSRRKDGRGTVRDARVVLDRRSPEGFCASDHYGVMADIQTSADARR